MGRTTRAPWQTSREKRGTQVSEKQIIRRKKMVHGRGGGRGGGVLQEWTKSFREVQGSSGGGGDGP